MSDAKSKNILKIENDEEEIKNIEETLKVLFDIVIDSSLFAFLSFNALSTLMSNFVANEIIVACQGTSSNS